jgi:guanylate kinase
MKSAYEATNFLKDYDYLVIHDNIDACTARVHGIIQSAHHTVEHEMTLVESLTTGLTKFQ